MPTERSEFPQIYYLSITCEEILQLEQLNGEKPNPNNLIINSLVYLLFRTYR
jgi:hypothetical protein